MPLNSPVSADNSAQSRVKSALVMAGGGLTGAVYELGALRALNDLLVDFTVNDFDIFVGTSAGALVAAGLATGIGPQEMLQSMDGDHPFIRPMNRRDLFRFNLNEFRKRGLALPRATWDAARHYLRNPGDFNALDLLWFLLDALPSAIYDPQSIERYVDDVIRNARTTNDFEALNKELYIIATELDSGDRAVFGRGYRRATIGRAVAASAALPLFYRPIRIGDREYVDGGLRGNASLDLAIERGAELVICLNPMTPIDHTRPEADAGSTRLSEHGMQAVADQITRILMHSGLHYHVKQLRRRHPNVDIILIEPPPDDTVMIDSNIMRLSSRMHIAQHGYESVTIKLASEYEQYKEVLARNQFVISRERVIPQLERLHAAGRDSEQVRRVLEALPPRDTCRPSSDLCRALDALEDVLQSMEDAGDSVSAESTQ